MYTDLLLLALARECVRPPSCSRQGPLWRRIYYALKKIRYSILGVGIYFSITRNAVPAVLSKSSWEPARADKANTASYRFTNLVFVGEIGHSYFFATNQRCE